MGKDNMTLPPLPHLVALALGLFGVLAFVRFASKEKRRVNDELDLVRADAINDAGQRRTLKRDPRTGVYRP
jgi:hypothetical protein